VPNFTEPDPDAYSRVTNPERFEPLHRFAMAHLDRLQAEYEVERLDGAELDPRQKSVDWVLSAVKLIPTDTNAAPIGIVLTTYPGLIVYCGKWAVLNFPECGCDACAETLEDEQQRLADVVDDVVGGRFMESIHIPFFGGAEQRWELWSSTHGRGGGARIPRSRARALVNAAGRRVDWSPWPLRRTRI